MAGAAILPEMDFIQVIMLLVSMMINMVTLLAVTGLGYLSAPFGDRWSGCICSALLVGCVFAFLVGQWYVFEVICESPPSWKRAYDVLFLLCTWCFLRTVFTDPGTPASEEWRAWFAEEGASLAGKAPAAEVRDEQREQCVLGGRPWFGAHSLRPPSPWPAAEASHCGYCNRARPERAHHCRRCGVCVLRMDHHCSLVGTCVGWRNHKYFLLLQLWQCAACFVVLYAPDGPGRVAYRGEAISGSFPILFRVDLAAVWAAGMFVITGKTFLTTLYSACVNETTVETQYVGTNPYRLPACDMNLQQLLGALCDPRLLFPVEPVGRDCDGASFMAPRRERDALKATGA